MHRFRFSGHGLNLFILNFLFRCLNSGSRLIPDDYLGTGIFLSRWSPHSLHVSVCKFAWFFETDFYFHRIWFRALLSYRKPTRIPCRTEFHVEFYGSSIRIRFFFFYDSYDPSVFHVQKKKKHQQSIHVIFFRFFSFRFCTFKFSTRAETTRRVRPVFYGPVFPPTPAIKNTDSLPFRFPRRTWSANLTGCRVNI